MKIYLVRGSSGEYGDSADWVVAAYSNKEKAEQRAKNAQESWEAAVIEPEHPYKNVPFNFSNPFDNLGSGYNISYWVHEMELIDE